jgi:tetratricopeptide (TPR) repeat protein
MSAGSPLFWGALGAFSFPFFMYLEQRLMPALAAVASRARPGAGAVTALICEAGVVGGLVYLVTRVLDAPMVPAVGTALSIGAFYALIMEYVLGDGAASHLASLLGGGGRGGAPRRMGHSRAATLALRGDHAGAIALYAEAIGRDGRDAALYLGLARALVTTGDPRSAVDELRRGVRRADTGSDQEAFLVRQIHEICGSQLGDHTEAIEDLRSFLAGRPESPHAEWAARALREIEDDFAAGARGLP